jgi:glyoxylase-like metal-dependent hydrolase (beta-lactamase superfamily II)
MNNWKISALYYGKITAPKSVVSAGIDPDLILDLPYMGYLLRNGKQNILVDTGIHEDNIVDGRAWGGFVAEGGTKYVLEALEKHNLKPKDIDTVIYTHLHNDHAGCASLFPEAATIYQKDEYANMINPIPTQKIKGDFDKRTPGDFAQLKDHRMIDGDLELPNGLRLYKLVGHTLGSIAIGVPTQEGRYLLTGDTPHLSFCLFPKMTRFQKLDGEFADITPAPDNYGRYLINIINYDQFKTFDSFDKVKMLAEKYELQWFLTGHDPWVLAKENFG